AEFQNQVLRALREKARIDEKNVTILAEAKVTKDKSPPVLSLPRDQFFLLQDLTEAPAKLAKSGGGVLHCSDDELAARLEGPWKEHVETLRARVAALKDQMPPEYSYLRAIRDVAKPTNLRVHIAGDKENLGEEAPRRFLAVLCADEPALFRK